MTVSEHRLGTRRPRIAAFHVEPDAYRLVRDWAAERGYDIVLLVTTPGPKPRTYLGYQEIVASAPANQDILVTTRFKRAAKIVAAAEPDLILSYTFPYRLPDEMLNAAPMGAVNLHPAPLPRFRGPNPHRMIYEGYPTIGAALHRTVNEFDAGPLFSVQEAPLPENPTVENVRAAYNELILAALDEGVARALAGEQGEPQNEAEATYAAGFTEDDYWLDWERDAPTLQRQATALNLVETRARAMVDGTPRLIEEIAPLRHGFVTVPSSADAGSVVANRDGWLIVLSGDGPVAVRVADEPVAAAPDAEEEAVGHGAPAVPVLANR